MNNILRNRDDHTTYRVLVGNPLWAITVYPPIEEDGSGGYIKDYGYRFDALPEWMHAGIQLMDVAGSGVLIEPLHARRVRDHYWFFCVDMVDPPKLPLTAVFTRSSDGI